MSERQFFLSEAIRGYMIAARARRLSPNTLALYDQAFMRFEEFLGEDPPLASITAATFREFQESLDWLSENSVRNYHTVLSALWTWALQEGLATKHVVREVAAPRPSKSEIIPYSREDVRLMLSLCDRGADHVRPGKARCDHGRPSALRARAIITLLVDTGNRASELCELRIHNCDLRNHRVTVMGKGRKERLQPISPRTAKAIWRYLASREDGERKAGLLFATQVGRPMERNALRRLLKRAGGRAGVLGVNVHRFRHTFAIEFLRNGGNAYALQGMLGHSTLTMVRRYLRLAQADLENAHRNASPVENWVL